MLQQLEMPGRPEASVNDTLAPVSRFFDRVNRPDQLPSSLLEAMRVLTDQAETGAVTIALPQDVQVEAADFPDQLFEPRVWRIARQGAAAEPLAAAVAQLREARRPLIVAGGGLRYSQAGDALRALVDATGIPVAETQAGKGVLPFDHPSALGALGATGTLGANLAAREADVVLAVGTRLSDFTTASHTAFQDPGLRLIALNVSGFDAHKLAALPLVADARAGLEQLAAALTGYRVDAVHADLAARRNREWDAEVERLTAAAAGPPTQAQVIGAVNAGRADAVVVCAAGSLPGDLHKLWRARDPDGYHLEYGYSCMGYEVAGGLGVKLAAPDREVIVMVGDGSWLMMSSEIATSVQEGARITVVLIDNKGFGSIGGLSRSLGSDGFGTGYTVSVDLVQNAASLGAIATRAETLDELTAALDAARSADRTSVIVIACDPARGVGSYESWWDVPVAEVSEMPAVQEARADYERSRGSAAAVPGRFVVSDGVRIGVVGAGMIAQVEHLPNLVSLGDRFQLVGVADPSAHVRAGGGRAPRDHRRGDVARPARAGAGCAARGHARPAARRHGGGRVGRGPARVLREAALLHRARGGRDH